MQEFDKLAEHVVTYDDAQTRAFGWIPQSDDQLFIQPYETSIGWMRSRVSSIIDNGANRTEAMVKARKNGLVQ